MPKLSLWQESKTSDYYFFDKIIQEQLEVGGTDILVHKYLGPHEQPDSGDPTKPSGPSNETTIQDLLFLENRDRNYDKHVYQLRAHYPVADNEFDLSQFGLMLANGVIFLVVHLNYMIDAIGRKIMSGDVIELPHLRDDALLSGDAVNQFYVVEEATRSAEGYSQTWYPHMWRIKAKPITDSPEFSDIFGTGEDEEDLKNILSSYNRELGISDAIIEAAINDVPLRNAQTAHLYVVPGDETGSQYPWVFAGDGEPPNGAELLGSGSSFPLSAKDGDWFLRTDYEPAVLFKKNGLHWFRTEVDYRKTWRTAHRLLESFINNDAMTELDDGEIIPEKQDIKKAVAPRVNITKRPR
ncbi:MAG: hypothetical protein WC284_14735 [Candidimonas sp.]